MSMSHAEITSAGLCSSCCTSPPDTETTTSSLPAENTHDQDHSSSLDSDSEDIENEWDLAVTHERNEELRKEERVRQFFAKVKTITEKSIWDQDIREWLRSLPFYMRGQAIPLFEDDTEGVSEDYQLHLGYSWLPSGEAAQDPDPHFYRLSSARNSSPVSSSYWMSWEILYIPLGRLFVNAPNGNRFNERCNSKRSRLSRWTGYEVFGR